MALTAFSGPVIAFGEVAGENNPDAGPSLFSGGAGLLGPGYNPSSLRPASGWLGSSAITTIDYIPTALGPATVYGSQAPVTGVALTKPVANSPTTTIGAAVGGATGLLLIDALRVSVTASIAGNIMTATVVSGTILPGTVIFSATGAITPATVVGYGTGRGDTGTYFLSNSQTFASGALIGAPGMNGVPTTPSNLSQTGSTLYNPSAMVGRALSITTAAGDTAIYTIRGYDIYGAAMSEAFQAAGATTVVGKKAFKWVASATPVGTVGATVTVGTADIFGLPLFSGSFSDVWISWAGTIISASTGHLAGSGAVATPTTGDVRGSYAVQSASDGSKRLIVRQSPAPQYLGVPGGFYGAPQA